MKGSALKPDKFFNNIPTLKAPVEESVEDITDAEKNLSKLPSQIGWREFVEVKDTLLSELDQTNALAIAQGAGYEEIGQNTVVITLAKEVITRLFNKVTDAKESAERPDGQ